MESSKTLPRPPLYKDIALIVLFCALPMLLIPLAEWAQLSEFPSRIFAALETYLFLLILPTLFLLISAPIGLFFPAVRRAALLALIGAIVYLGAFITGRAFGEQIRHRVFVALAERSTPLVRAITAYTQEKGSPPHSLEALVPQYLTEVPTTGIRKHASYGYMYGHDSALYESNPWILYVSCGQGFANFDMFYYFPRQNYPDSGYGGTIQRIRDWGYLHE